MRRGLICLLAGLTLATACSGDDDAASESSTTTTTTTEVTAVITTTTATEVTAVTTTTTATEVTAVTTTTPAEYIPCPRGLEVVTTVDTDGDGIGEEVIFARNEGGQLFLVCGREGGRSMRLDYGVWYVALQARGGEVEVFLGAATIGDGPDRVAALFRRLDFAGPELAFVPEVVDVVADPIRVTPPADICDTVLPAFADADGDGTEDVIGRRFVETELQTGPAIVVCTATGDVAEALVGAMEEVFAVSTATGDRATIWLGERLPDAVSLEPHVWADGWIVPIESDAGPLLLNDGFVTKTELDGYGCGDLDGNGIIELVAVEGELDGDELSWVRRSWETDGAAATLVTDGAGTLRVTGAADLGSLVYGDVLPSSDACEFVEIVD